MERDNQGRFVKGIVPWNKGLKFENPKARGRKNPKSGFQKGHKNFNKGGNKWKIESRIKLSMSQTGEKEFNGFKREIRKRIMRMREYLEWRSAVFKRDNYHCQNCGEKGYIEAHHIIPFKEIIKKFGIKTIEQAIKCKELWDVGNGITFCRDCHILLDENVGKREKSNRQLNSTGGI
jgi:hypothetical protein